MSIDSAKQEGLRVTENPYNSPSVNANTSLLPPRFNFFSMATLIGVGVGGGIAMGAATSAINATIYPDFYSIVLNSGREDIWFVAVKQGSLEGGIYGGVYALIFIVLIAVVSKRRCRMRVALRYAGLCFAIAFTFWLIGGIVSVTLTMMFPELEMRQVFRFIKSWPDLGYLAWVHGSINGIVFGGLVSVLFTNILYFKRFRQSDVKEVNDWIRKSLDGDDDRSAN